MLLYDDVAYVRAPVEQRP